MSYKLKKKFNVILARESRMAKSVALQAIKPKPFSVWEVLIPVIFILSFMRSKEQREIFSQNLMFTKKMALEAAFEMLNKEQAKEAVMRRIASETQRLLSAVPNGVYSDAIRQKQLKEIDLLIDHYCKLMRAEGGDYVTLVANAYQTKEKYAVFQDKLTSAERAVTQAARETLGDQTDDQMAARIEAASGKFRRQEVETIFSPHAQH
ncbi:MAG: NF038143 family protein [Desulfobacterales bacterium]|nr:MAG: NF038143 family protein [Desulfobacterales bacterium]